MSRVLLIALLTFATLNVARADTIGNSTAGSNARSTATGACKGILITSFPGGTLNHAIVKMESTSGTWQMGVLDTSGNVLAESTARSDITTANTYQFEFADESIAAQDINLLVCGTGQSAAATYNQDTDTYDGRQASGVTVSPLTDPITIIADSTRDYSMLVDYTPAAGGSIVPIIMHNRRQRSH